MNKPLALKLAPTSLKEVIGQTHLVGENKIITNLVKNKHLCSMILYGRPGIGKTSIANAIVHDLKMPYRFLNATMNNKSDFDIAIEEAKMHGNLILIAPPKERILLFFLAVGLFGLIICEPHFFCIILNCSFSDSSVLKS